MIIAGDIGGTKTNVALFQANGSEVGPVLRQQKFPSGGYDSLEAILKEFIGDTELKITGACFGIAAPVIEGHAKTPNLNWTVSAASLAEVLRIDRVGLINDLEATAFGIPALSSSQLLTLNTGDVKDDGHRALIAAGTGLGMAGIFYRDGHYHPLASEGGHSDYAPHEPVEIEFLQYLKEKFGRHVSWERVLSGPGLFNVYSFLRDRGDIEEPAGLAEQIKSGDKTAAVSAAALGNKSELAVKALDMFVTAYGAMAGNLALLMMATGGLYVGGGIAPKISEKLKDGMFMKAFTDKGRLSSVLTSIPVHVILEDKTALFGAARAALKVDG
ncbi:MAG: glucokinase [Blastocatellia bacterium]|nr:glucokinase [Blastocatellia bacterium]